MLKKIILLLIITAGTLMSQDSGFAGSLYNNYEKYREASLSKRRFKHADIVPLIEQLKNKNIYTVNKAGKSAQGRDIYLVNFGTGKTKVFMWSQMHGDEPTATMALFDIFNFLDSGDMQDFKNDLLSKLTIYVMPMVNPDGAEVFDRRNSYNIDINRDAVRQQTPEGRVLRTTFDRLKAEFGFNLHDQSTRYSAGNTFRPATLSFLAPTTNYEKTMNDVREKAIRLIGVMYNTLSVYIPGHIAKYSDEFEPRAFGDNFQKWGTSTILVESGGWEKDTEKQFIRKMNFIGLLTALKSIADESYKNEPVDTYESIPFNEKFIMDLVLRNLSMVHNGEQHLLDIGINQNEINNEGARDFYYSSTIEDVGDLSVFYGYEDLELKGYEAVPGKVFPKEFSKYSEIEKLDFKKLLSDGYTYVRLNSDETVPPAVDLPINIILNKYFIPKDDFYLLENPSFTIRRNEKVVYAVVNGFIHDIENLDKKSGNGLLIK